jgi:hypothetical protein
VPAPEHERTGWFLSGEAKRIIAARDEANAAERWPAREAGVRRITRLGPYDVVVEDVGPRPIISRKRFRDPAAFVRKRLEQLFDSKKRGAAKDIADAADVLTWQAKGFSVREIAEEMGRTQGWVRWRLHGISKIFIRHGISNLSQRSQQETDIASH